MARAAVARTAALGAAAANRYPCGKLKPSHPPAAIKRIVENAMRRGSDALLGTPIGQLLLHYDITARQASAAFEYARLRTAYDRVVGLPRRRAKVLGECDWLPEWTEEDAGRIRSRFEAMRDKILELGQTGVQVVSILDDTCVDLQMPSWPDQILLRAGLDKVAEHFRISGEKLAA